MTKKSQETREHLDQKVGVRWMGPSGHFSHLFGNLEPGKVYIVDVDLAKALLDSPLWEDGPEQESVTDGNARKTD